MGGMSVHDLPEDFMNQIRKELSKHCNPDSFNITVNNNGHFAVYIRICAKEDYTDQIGFNLIELPGCCMYVISTATHISGIFKNKRLSYVLQDWKYQLAKHWGYTRLFCTVTTSNEPEMRVMKRAGWKEIDKGVNNRTGNEVAMFIKNIVY